MSQVNINGDPKVVGPGVWYVIHLKAKESINNDKIDEFIDFMETLSYKFGCSNCRKHIQAYIKDHPFEDLRNIQNSDDEKIGMFKWAWLFHNAVNTRLNKPYVEWDTAWEMYDEGIEVCSKQCDEAGDEAGDETEDNNQPTNNNEQTTDSQQDQVTKIPIETATDRKSKLAQGYFMNIGIPKTLERNGMLSYVN